MPTGPTLSELEGQADTIIVGKILSAPEDAKLWVKRADGVWILNWNSVPKSEGEIGKILFASQIRSAGSYDIVRSLTLKGDVEQDKVKFSAPPLSQLAYKSVSFRANPSDTVIIFLRRNKDDQLSVADDLLYFIPIDREVAGEELSGSTSEKIRTLMMKSLAKGSFVQPLIYLLQDMRGNEMISISAKLVNNKDAQIRDYALNNLAINQQVGAIPLIAEEGRAYAKDNRVPANAVFNLWQYKVPEAADSLQPLLFEPAYFFRDLALEPLSSTGNKDGIPYYILTLLDTRKEASSAVRSAYILKRLTKLPINFKGSAALADQQATFQQFISWWQDELAAKHPAAEGETEQPAVTLRQLQKFEASDLPQLNQGLFMLSETTRRAAARGLEQFADASSIPYLLIALYDPQPDIALSGYTTLHRLIPSLGAASRAKWEKEREAETKVALDWWQQHLIDADKPPAPPAPVKAPTVLAPTVR